MSGDTDQPRRVFLTGLSDSGKSTVAKLVADSLGRRIAQHQP